VDRVLQLDKKKRELMTEMEALKDNDAKISQELKDSVNTKITA
jgi:seryl-tRNA synthetase